MQPKDFWENQFRDNIIYCQSQLARRIDELRDRIVLLELTTNKMIKADSMSQKHPKILKISDNYKELFKKEKRRQTPEEQARIFYQLIEAEKGKWR